MATKKTTATKKVVKKVTKKKTTAKKKQQFLSLKSKKERRSQLRFPLFCFGLFFTLKKPLNIKFKKYWGSYFQ